MKIVLCLPGPHVSHKVLGGLVATLGVLFERGIEVVLSARYTSNVYFVRSMCLGADVLRGTAQRPWNGQLLYDYIWWLDSDIVFQPAQLLALIAYLQEHKSKHIVSGLYPMEGRTHYPCVEKMDLAYFKRHGSFDFLPLEHGKSQPFSAAYNGMGFMLVRRGVFEKIPYPWFRPRMYTLPGADLVIEDFCSEDVGFCLAAAEAGFPVYVLPSVVVGHEKRVVL